MSKRIQFIISFIGIIFLGLISLQSGSTVEAQEEPVWERFAAFDPASEITVNHSPLSEIMRQTVFPLGSSKRILGTKANAGGTYTGTRIGRGGNSAGDPARYEGNRLMVHAFTDEHTNFYLGYQKGLEALSMRRPLSELNKNEQLAFWLNLHTVIVINKLAEEYPIGKLKKLRNGKPEKTFWYQKVATVEGVPLSLMDIENIVIHNFDKPEVIYGLYQGSIGGPTLQTQAYEGETVWTMLENGAMEFVNSNRGVRPKGTRADVSKFYDWSKAAFGGSDQVLLDHINAYASYGFFGDISNVQTLKYKIYNWKIADLLGGTLHSGITSNYAAFLANYNGNQSGGGDVGGGSRVGGETSFGSIDLTGWLVQNAPEGFSLENMVPPHAYDLIKAAYATNNIPRRIPVVTTYECEPGDPCEDVDIDG